MENYVYRDVVCIAAEPQNERVPAAQNATRPICIHIDIYWLKVIRKAR